MESWEATYIDNPGREFVFHQRCAGVGEREQTVAGVSGGIADARVVHVAAGVELAHVACQDHGIVDGGHAQTRHLRPLRWCGGHVLSRLERVELVVLLAELHGEGQREGLVDDVDDLAVVFCQVEAQRCIGDTALLFSGAGCLEGDVLQEVPLVVQADELESLLDRALDALAIASNVAQ